MTGTQDVGSGGTDVTARGATDLTAVGDASPGGDAAPAPDGAVLADAAGTVSDGGCPEGAACDDKDPCTAGDQCQAGVCKGIVKDCSAGLSPCKKGSCIPSSGLCLIEDKDGACDDGDPCTQADQCLLGACTGFAIAGCCTPDCKGKVCGDDGCGTPCGTCKAGEVCGAGACVQDSPAGETCADAKQIAVLPFHHVGTTKGAQNDLQAPDQACYNGSLGTYSPDVVYSYTPPADLTLSITLSGYSNKPAFYLASNCGDIKNSCLVGQLGYGQKPLGPAFAAVKKGQTVYLVVDADDNGGDYVLDVATCAPDCNGKQCGSDGCGGVCGYCPKLSAFECSNIGTCVCVPNCYSKKCGSNGCGGTCGTCAADLECDDGNMLGQFTGNCVKPGQLGDKCSSAIAVDKSPFTYSGSTVGLGNNLYGWSFCDGNGTGAYYGDEAPDMVFAVGGGAAGTWLVDLPKKSTNLVMYALTDCADPISCKQAGYHPYTLKTQLLVENPTGAPIFVAVDGYSTQSGTFTLQATQCKLPADCPGATAGDYCSWPVEVTALPFKANGSLGLDSYNLPVGACGTAKALGKGGGNVAYRFTAPKAGTYTAKVVGTGGMDPIVYATKDCTKLATSCAALVDKSGAGGTETLTFAAQAGEVWHVIVDAQTSVNGTFSIELTGP